MLHIRDVRHKVLTSNQTAWHGPPKISRSLQKEASAFEQDLDRRWHQKREAARTKMKKSQCSGNRKFSTTAFPKQDSRPKGQISDHCLPMTWSQSEYWVCLWATRSLEKYRLEFKSHSQHLLTTGLQARYLSYLSFNVFICKVGKILRPPNPLNS